MRTVDINIKVEVDEIIEELGDDDLNYIAQQAGYFPKDNCIDDAIDRLRETNHLDASEYLDKFYNPKYASAADCRKAYNEAMGRD